jgi:hypothetical protein
MLMSTNYVYSLWVWRSAFAEIWVYSLIPWVADELRAEHPSLLKLGVLTSVQIAGHPIVLLHSVIAELLIAYGLSDAPLVRIVRACALSLVAACVIAAPFWLPQLLWRDAILGPGGLPVSFGNSFLTAANLLHPLDMRSVGPTLILAVLVILAANMATLSRRSWALAAGFAVLLAIQTVYLKPISVHIPTVETGLFIWRLMFACALLGIGFLLSAQSAIWPRFLALLSVLFFINLAVFFVMRTSPFHIDNLRDNGTIIREYETANTIWGVLEFMPNYTRLPRACDVPGAQRSTRVAYAALRDGVRIDSDYMVVRNAPVDFVSYRSAGQTLPLSACGDDLVIGPLGRPGAIVEVSDKVVKAILIAKLALVALFVVGFCWILATRRRSPRPAV